MQTNPQAEHKMQKLAVKMQEARDLRQQMRNTRFHHRKVLEEQMQRRMVVPRGMPCNLGIDSRGQYIRLKKGINLKIEYLDNGLVRMGTGLQKGWAGKRMVGGVPERKSTLDIFSAIRRAIHIQEELHLGRATRDVAIDLVEEMNSNLTKFGEWGSPLWLYSVKVEILKLSKDLQETVNPLKQEAWEMLENAAKSVGKAAVETGDLFRKRNLISIACSKLASFRLRLGEWRDKQVEGMVIYNKIREHTLRAERDWRAWNALDRMAKLYSREDKKWAIFGRDQKDLRYAMRMEELASSSKRANTKVGLISELIEEMEKNRYTWGGKGFSLEILKEAKNLYGAGKNEKARKALRRGKLILEMNKPEFIAEQLEKAEEYMQPVAEKIREGANHITALLKLPHRDRERGERLSAAVGCFREALNRMEQIER
jgi:hypothetical protein